LGALPNEWFVTDTAGRRVTEATWPTNARKGVTFQVSEGRNGILFQYKDVDAGAGSPASPGAQATVGIRDTNGETSDRVLQWSFDAPVLHNNEAISFTLDSTPPVITPLITGTQGNNGWYTSAVTVNWNVSDPESGISSSSCGPVTLSNDTNGTTLQCTATNGVFLSGTASVTIKIDKTPPTVSCSVTPDTLWPPNHKLVAVTATVTVNDALSGKAGFVLQSVTSNEPDDGLGDGDTANDIQGFSVGTPSVTGQLRAERSGSGNGRIYTLVYQGKDIAGNQATCSTTVRVPKSQ
jgi:hypothetical protein